MSVLDPLSHALAALVTAAHTGLTSLGADPDSGTTWVLCLALVVLAVRLALLPLVVRGVRHAHASARARPQLRALQERYRHRTDLEGRQELAREARRLAAEHRVPRLGLLPALVQLPIWIALYRLVSDVAAGSTVGALSSALVASFGAATVLAVPLADRGYLGAGWPHLVAVAGLASVAAVLSFVTQRWLVAPNALGGDVPEAVVRAQQLMPAISAVGLLVAGGVVPVALLVYWVCNGTWTLGQSYVVWRWFPTPGSPAAARRAFLRATVVKIQPPDQ